MQLHVVRLMAIIVFIGDSYGRFTYPPTAEARIISIVMIHLINDYNVISL